MDHRVAQEREDEMLESAEFAGEPGGEDWTLQRESYYYRALCQSSRPEPGGLRSAYLESTNAANVIPRNTIPVHEQLIHGASLNRILSRLATGEYPTGDLELAFSGLTGREFPSRIVGLGLDRAAFARQVDDLADDVNRRGPEVVRSLAGLLCEPLRATEPPWWAGFAQELMPLLQAEDGAGLCQALGMGHLEEGEWLIVWRYEVGLLYLQNPDAYLYRPTVVEANSSPFHFPSPPGYPYGITMSLADDRRGDCREVIHPPLQGQAAADACTGVLYRIAHPPISGYDRIAVFRGRHRQRLKEAHPQPDTDGWLARHPRSS